MTLELLSNPNPRIELVTSPQPLHCVQYKEAYASIHLVDPRANFKSRTLESRSIVSLTASAPGLV